jgi:hypothetical protein
MEDLGQKGPRTGSVYRIHKTMFFPHVWSITGNKSSMAGATSRTGTVYPYGTSVLRRVRVAGS